MLFIHINIWDGKILLAKMLAVHTIPLTKENDTNIYDEILHKGLLHKEAYSNANKKFRRKYFYSKIYEVEN